MTLEAEARGSEAFESTTASAALTTGRLQVKNFRVQLKRKTSVLS